MKKLSPRTVSFLKYLVAFALVGFVLNKMGLEKILFYMKEISPFEALGAFACITAAQLASAFRMRYFFTAAQFRMSKHFAIVLFYVGAFYNFLLPGGIGGDAYKVILARRRMDMPAAQGIRLMIADRASGLCILLLSLITGFYLIGAGNVFPYGNFLLMLAALVVPVAYLYFSKLLLRQYPHDMLGSLSYSIVAQLFWMASVVMLWKAVGHGAHLTAFVTLYCAASIASMIPVSVGGLGIRELTYVYGAVKMHDYLGLDVNPDMGVAISLCLFVMTFVSSLPGLLWLNKAARAEISRDVEPTS